LEGSLGIPLPAATQCEIVAETAQRIQPALEELIRQAAQGEVLDLRQQRVHRLIAWVLAQALHQQLDSFLFMTLLQQLKSGSSALIDCSRCRRSSAGGALCCTARATHPQTQSEKCK
jgi:hypothetical protein